MKQPERNEHADLVENDEFAAVRLRAAEHAQHDAEDAIRVLLAQQRIDQVGNNLTERFRHEHAHAVDAGTAASPVFRV